MNFLVLVIQLAIVVGVIVGIVMLCVKIDRSGKRPKRDRNRRKSNESTE